MVMSHPELKWTKKKKERKTGKQFWFIYIRLFHDPQIFKKDKIVLFYSAPSNLCHSVVASMHARDHKEEQQED